MSVYLATAFTVALFTANTFTLTLATIVAIYGLHHYLFGAELTDTQASHQTQSTQSTPPDWKG